MQHVSLIDVDRDSLPGEISWWFSTEDQVESLASEIEGSTDLAYRFGALYVACQWYWQQDQPLPPRLLRTFRLALEIHLPPDGIDLGPDAVGRLCGRVTNWWRETGDARNAKDQRRRRSADAIPVQLRRDVAGAVAAYSSEGKPIPVELLNAIAHLFGLVSPSNGRALPASRLLRLIGLPHDVEKLELFLRAARLEGEAMVQTVDNADPSAAFAEIDASVRGRIALNHWAMSERAVSMATNVARSTIRSWRTRGEYRRLARAKAVWQALGQMAWANWNRPRGKPSAT